MQLSNYTPTPIPYRDPIRWDMVGQALITVTVLALSARFILPVLTNRWTWSTVTLITILVMTSGFMFVRIRGMPYRTVEHAIARGFQTQYGAEIWIISTKCKGVLICVRMQIDMYICRFLAFRVIHYTHSRHSIARQAKPSKTCDILVYHRNRAVVLSIDQGLQSEKWRCVNHCGKSCVIS